MSTNPSCRYCWLFCVAVFFATPTVCTAQSDSGNAPAKPVTLQLYVLSDGDENAKPLALNTDYDGQGSPQWSPDGKLIAFDAWRESSGETFGKAHVFVINADGKNLRNLGIGAMPSFSADGQRIAFSRYSPNRGVWTMNVDGSQKELLDAEGWCAKWSPDGNKIAFTVHRGRTNIVLYDVKAKTRSSVLTDEHSQMYSSIYWNYCWSPDSNRLCFRARRPDGTHDVAITDASSSGNGFQVRLQQVTGNEFSWHPNGKTILFAMPNPMRKLRQLYTINPDGKDQPRWLRSQPLDHINVCGSWSRDGKQIVFSSKPIVKKTKN